MHFASGRAWAAIAATFVVWVRASAGEMLVQVSPPTLDADSALMTALMEEGSALFGAECITCHGADGSSDFGPALTGNISIAAKDFAVKRLLEGVKDMPAFAPTMTDRQVAAVATFIRNSWDNAHGIIVETDVKRIRDTLPRPPGR